MSTEIREELAAAGQNGDDGLDPTLSPPPGDDGAEGTPAEKAEAAAWLEGADDELLAFAANKGWDKDPVAGLKSYREAERALAESRKREAQMEGRLAEAVQQRQQMPANGDGQLSPEQEIQGYVGKAAELYEEGQISTAQFAEALMQAGRAQGRIDAEAMVGQRVGPIAQKQNADSMQRTAAEIDATYEDFKDLSDEVLALIHNQPQLYGTSEGMWAAYGLVKSQHQRKESVEARKAAASETLTDSARSDGGQAQEAGDAIRKQLREARGGGGIARDPLG